jgi:hypothetical protein
MAVGELRLPLVESRAVKEVLEACLEGERHVLVVRDAT